MQPSLCEASKVNMMTYAVLICKAEKRNDSLWLCQAREPRQQVTREEFSTAGSMTTVKFLRKHRVCWRTFLSS